MPWLPLFQQQRLCFWIDAKIRLARGIGNAGRGRPAGGWESFPVPVEHVACPLVSVRFAALIQRRILSQFDRKPEALQIITGIALESSPENSFVELSGDQPTLGEHHDVFIEALDPAPALIDLPQEFLLFLPVGS